MIEDRCIDNSPHNFLFTEYTYHRTRGSYNSTWTRIGRFYCSKCLRQEDVTDSEDSRDPPTWWKDV